MQFQAAEAKRVIAAYLSVGPLMPPAQTVEIMARLDEIRAQIGLRYAREA